MSYSWLVCVFDVGKCTPSVDKGMNTESYFSQYESPNIVIIPNMSLSNPPSPKRRKIGNNILVPIVDNATCEKIKFQQQQENSQDKKVDKNINSPKSPKKKASWASNYLQSIGLDSKSSIWQHKIPRKNASKRSVSASNFKGTMTSNVPLTCSTNTESEKSLPKEIKPNSLEEKPKIECKNNIETRKTKTQNNKEKPVLTEHSQLQKEYVNTIAQKHIEIVQNKPAATTFSNTNKCKNNIIVPKTLKTANIMQKNLVKRIKDECAGCTSLVDKHSLPKNTEKTVKAKKHQNSKMSTDHPKFIHKQRAVNRDERSNCPYSSKSNCQEEIQNSAKSTKQIEKYIKRSKSSTSDCSDNLKTKYKTQQRSIGHVTSVKSVVKVTKKYDINDLNKLTASKKSTKTDRPANTAACKQENVRKSTEEILSRKKLDSKPRTVKHKKIIESPIKKQSHRTNKYRKIKLVINVVCNNNPVSAPSNRNDINGSPAGAIQNVDLDFLNDFDVDEIVQSLDICDREKKKLESEITLNKENCNVNSNIFPGAYDNDALDLIKILKGEEDDDLLKQSIEGTTQLFSSNNIRSHTPCIDPYNMLDHIPLCNKVDIISRNELVTPIKIKEEKQENITDVTADLHDEESTYDSQTNYGNKIICKQNTHTLNLCAKIPEDHNDTISSNDEKTNKARTDNQVINNDKLDAEANTDLKLTLKTIVINNKKCNEIIEKEEKSETTSTNQDDTNTTHKEETVKKMDNNVSYVSENTDSDNQNVNYRETEFTEVCDVQKEKDVKFYNNETETTGSPVRQLDNTNKQSNTDILNVKGKIEQKNIGSQNLVINNEGKTTLIPGELKNNTETDASAKKSTVVNDKNNDNRNDIKISFTELNQITKQIDNENKEKTSNEVHMKSVSNVSAEHKKPTSPEKQVQEKYKDSKNLNDKEKNSENQVNKEQLSKSKPKANDCLSETVTSLDEKINKKALLLTPLTTYKDPNTDVDIARKLEKRMFAYLGTKYSILTTIHQGKFSSIFKCKHPSGKHYALKLLNTNHAMNMQKKHMLYSLQNGRPKNSLFTIYLVSVFSFTKKWYILMDYYPKNLDQVLSEVDKPFCIESVQEYARQLVTAVMVLKSNNMVHSDIKPQHILINSFNSTLKLCGFDNLSYVNQMNALPCVGTASYRAPELILGYSAGFEIDIWSTALVLYEMAVKQKLLPGVFNNDILYKQICTLGTVPIEMIRKSAFASNHFCGTTFMRRSGFKGQKICKINNIAQNNRLRKTIYDAYRHYWSNQRNMAEQNCDYKKLASFITLLEKMLVMHPKYRIAIEYVVDNIFIYDVY